MEYSIPHGSLPPNISTILNASNTNRDTPPPNYPPYSFKQPFQCSYIHNLTFHNGSWWILESPHMQDEVRRLCGSITILSDAFFWLAVILGIPGNLSAVITLFTMPKSTCTFYIALLAVLDLNAILLKMTMRLLNTHGVRLGDIGCKTLMASTNFIVTYANWVLVLICLERFVTIRFPLKKPVYFTIKRARYSAVCLGCSLCPFFLVLFYIYEEAPPNSSRSCWTKTDLKELAKAWSHLVTALYSFIPSVLLFLHVGLITMALRKHKKRREYITETCQEKISLRVSACTSRNSVQIHCLNNQRHQLDKLERSVTGMLLMAAIVFLVLTTPICVVMVMNYDLQNGTPASYARWKMTVTVARALVLMSHALNCYIYFLTCKKFRGHLFGGISKLFVKAPPARCRSQSATATTRIQVTEITPWNNHV